MARYNFSKTIVHSGLNKTKTIYGNSRYEIAYKEQIQIKQWEEQWQRKLQIERNRKIAEEKRLERENRAKDDQRAILNAQILTKQAEEQRADIGNILINSLECELYDFEKLKKKDYFSKNKPYMSKKYEIPREPLPSDSKYNPKLNFWAVLSGKKQREFNEKNRQVYNDDHKDWEKIKNEIIEKNKYIDEIYEHQMLLWKEEKKQFENEQQEYNHGIDEFRNEVANGNSVDEFVSIILNDIKLPINFIPTYDVLYDKATRNVVIDVNLPLVTDYPNLKSVAYIKSRHEYKESYFNDVQMQKMYDDSIYKIILMYINRVFNINNQFDLIDNIVLNGFVESIDKTTGNEFTAYILSISIARENFKILNLKSIDAREWFKKEKGISAAKIAQITPIQPIQRLNKEDKRFVEGYNVVNEINDEVNLASIDWQDFENLIREIFQEEFNSSGGEVKITQASRDGGVDAVVFDPDPIRGGKIVIQAKRYTNVVGVSAVRDLYGTLMNEGAMKGILVTTSNYGNDAYEFAKSKPIQLINGAELLGLLEKHGHKAKIDLKEAKLINKGNNNLI